MNVAETILHQLGGGRFVAMTGCITYAAMRIHFPCRCLATKVGPTSFISNIRRMIFIL